MGDRANVFVKDNLEVGKGVFLYTHWGGDELPLVVRDALHRGIDRWDDPQYLTRIIFCEMVKEDVDGLTGYGISASMGDNERPLITVDVRASEVSFGSSHKWKLADYIRLNKSTLLRMWGDAHD